jgi:hypothetical protein
MRWLAIPLLALPFLGVATELGWLATTLFWAQLVIMLGVGQLACRWIGIRDDPFLAFVTGFAVLTHAMLLGAVFSPSAQLLAALACGVLAVVELRRDNVPCPVDLLALGVFVALFALVWNIDVPSRVAHFHATGELRFFNDLYVHSGHLGQFAAPAMLGRGMALLADVVRPPYHYASMMPAALVTQLTSIPLIDAAALIWIPGGALIMAAGMTALAMALSGPGLAASVLIAMAMLPDPERLATGNGFLGFAWLVEASPGTPYSLGISCAALAVLVRWMRDQRAMTLAGAWALVASCLLIRANIFVWLAPLVALGTVVGWQRLRPVWRIALVCTGLLAMTGLLLALSWTRLRAYPGQFILALVEIVYSPYQPSYVGALYPKMVTHLGRPIAGLIGLALLVFGTLGPWLPAFVVAAHQTWRRRCLTAADALPGLLLAVAVLAMALGPMAGNGDITEYRHRALPLLVLVFAVWSLHLAIQSIQPLIRRLTPTRLRCALAMLAGVSLGMLGRHIDEAKQPALAMQDVLFHDHTAPELMALAPLLTQDDAPKPRFIVANQPEDTRGIDDAARLVALTGVPAYLSCAALQIARGEPWRTETERRLMVSRRLTEAPDLTSLRSIMRAEGITRYVATTPADAPFDPARLGAIQHVGTYAVYGP